MFSVPEFARRGTTVSSKPTPFLPEMYRCVTRNMHVTVVTYYMFRHRDEKRYMLCVKYADGKCQLLALSPRIHWNALKPSYASEYPTSAINKGMKSTAKSSRFRYDGDLAYGSRESVQEIRWLETNAVPCYAASCAVVRLNHCFVYDNTWPVCPRSKGSQDVVAFYRRVLGLCVV